MNDQPKATSELDLVELSASQKAARSSRNKAIALCLVAMIVVFYAATISRFGSAPGGAQLENVQHK